MNIEELRRKASQEILDIISFIRNVQILRTKYPGGIDFYVPEEIIPHLEAYCDSADIPFCVVAEHCCSTASTYSKLVSYEEAR